MFNNQGLFHLIIFLFIFMTFDVWLITSDILWRNLMLFCVKVSKVNLFPAVPYLTEKIEKKGNKPLHVQVDRGETRIGEGCMHFSSSKFLSFSFWLLITLRLLLLEKKLLSFGSTVKTLLLINYICNYCWYNLSLLFFVITFKSEIDLMYCMVIFVDLEPFSNAFFCFLWSN